MNNKKKYGFLKVFICILIALFTFSYSKTLAEISEVSLSGKNVDTITSVKVSNNEGGNLSWDLEQWATFRLNATFDLTGRNVNAGDTTIITIPDSLIITSDSFTIRDINTNEIIANAKINANNKSISITYTDYVEKHSDTKGSFFFYSRIDFIKPPQKGEIPIEIKVNAETKIAGKVSFKGIGDGNPKVLNKTSWVDSSDFKTIYYIISINQTKDTIQDVTIEEQLKFTHAIYEKDSFRIIKGEFAFVNGQWKFTNTSDVRSQHKIIVSEDGQSFSANLGNKSLDDQYCIVYKVHLNYSPVDGEVLRNEAILRCKNFEEKKILNAAAVQIAGGTGVGYVFTINIHKVNDSNQPLKGAKFKVVRQANNQVIGEYVTDDKGNITVNALLKDKYILTGLEAPSGYRIQVADTEVNVEDFGPNHFITKTIVNQKEETITTTSTTQETTTTVTTTEEPRTTITTTKEPKTTVITTKEPKTTITTTKEPRTAVTTTKDKPGLPKTG